MEVEQCTHYFRSCVAHLIISGNSLFPSNLSFGGYNLTFAVASYVSCKVSGCDAIMCKQFVHGEIYDYSHGHKGP